jgi:predicted RNase H-like HicB family nuclease
MVTLADQPREIGCCDFTKVKRVEITLRGEPFPHLLAACGGAPNELRTVRLHHDRLIVVLGSDWACQLLRASGNGGHGLYQRHLFPDQRWWAYTARRRCSRRRSSRGWSSVFVLGKATVEIPHRVKPGLGLTMAEQIISLHVELLPEGCYLATSEAIPGLVAQGRTVAETLEIARDVAKRLLEARAERGEHTAMSPEGDCLDLPLVVGG